MEIPFPTLSRSGDESEKLDERPPLHVRTHSSPSTPNFMLTTDPSRHLRQILDLASSPNTSPLPSPLSTKTKKLSISSAANGGICGSPRRAPSLNTPPLTPSSSFNSSSHDNASDCAPTTPEPVSPIRWGVPHSAGKSQVNVTSLQSYLTPSSIRSRSISSGDARVDIVTSDMRGLDLASPSSDATPKAEKAFNLSGKGSTPSGETINVFNRFFTNCEGAKSSRFVLVRNIPIAAACDPSSEFLIRTAFNNANEVSGIVMSYLKSCGVIVLAYYDLRATEAAVKRMHGKYFDELCPETGYGGDREKEKRVEAVKVDIAALGSLVDLKNFVEENNPIIYLTLHQPGMDLNGVMGILKSCGDVLSIEAVVSPGAAQTYRVEFFNMRAVDAACARLHNRHIFNTYVTVWIDRKSEPTLTRTRDSRIPPTVDLTSPFKSALPLPGDNPDQQSRRATWQNASSLEDPFVHRHSPAHLLPGHTYNQNAIPSNGVGMYDRQAQWATSEFSFGHMSPPPMSEVQLDMHAYPPHQAQPYLPPFQSAPHPHPPLFSPHIAPPFLYHGSPPPPEAFMPMPTDNFTVPSPLQVQDYWAYAGHHHNYTFSSQRMHTPSQPLRQVLEGFDSGATESGMQAHPPRRERRNGQSRNSTRWSHGSSFTGDCEPPAENNTKNQLNLDTIEGGGDTRTTVMIKNIPNKMSDRDLLDFIDRVCPRTIDFLYLRMDFQNGCNVGYAFVNFITVQDLLHFARTQLGVKWNMYSSEKTLQLSYANYQGKEALVEKFKNSCIMDERESWRPKIFYSSGPDQGLPEPFPAPTHLRRKERSAHNRGALFVPGPGSRHHHHDGFARESRISRI